MTREEIISGGLLDQYVLGLTNREQTEQIEVLMKEDEEVREEIERLRDNLNAYANQHSILPPPDDGRSPRSMEDFYGLDHEMILELTERNHKLNIWRYCLVAACALLIALCGFLYRGGEVARGELKGEQARHAQDKSSFEHELARFKQCCASGK